MKVELVQKWSKVDRFGRPFGVLWSVGGAIVTEIGAVWSGLSGLDGVLHDV